MPAVLALSITVLGSFVLLAWISGMDRWAAMVPDLGRMRANSAFGLVLGGLSVLFARKAGALRAAAIASRTAAVLLLLLGAATAIENLWSVDLSIDGLFVRAGTAAAGAVSGRMGTTASFCAILAGFALVLALIGRRWSIVASQCIAVGAEICVLPAMLVWAYGLTIDGGAVARAQMAPHTAIGYCALGIAILGLRTDTGPVGILLSKGQVGANSRQLLATVVLLIPAVGWLILRMGTLWNWDLDFTVATLALASLLALTVVIVITTFRSAKLAERSHLAELDRERLLERIQLQNSGLEQTIAARTAALRETNDELRRVAEEAQRLAMVASRTTNEVVMLDARGSIEWVNDSFTRNTGYKPAEVVGRRPGDLLFGPGSDAATTAQIREAIAAGRGIGCELLIYTKDRRPYWVRVDIQPVRSEDGTLQRFSVIQSDITEIVERRDALHLSEERLQLATQALDVGVWDWQADGTILWDDGMLRLFGVSREEFDAEPIHWREYLHPDDRDYVVERIRILRQTGIRDDIQYRIVRPDGEVRHLRTGMVAVDTGSGQSRMIGINLDITAERRSAAELREAKEAAELASRAKTEFVALMSHEIRTPMNGVLGFTELLRDSPLSQHQLDWVETIRTSGEALLSIINDILDFSKIESGHLDVHVEAISLKRLVDDIMAIVSRAAALKNIAITSEIEDGIPFWVRTDGNRLRQILLNVVSNAVKFTDAGSVSVRVSAASDARQQPLLEFLVTDTGPGIPGDRAPEVFEPFRQLDLSAARRHGGTGLGLAISRRLCRLLGGDIEIGSTSPAGTTFRFYVPLDACEAPTAELASGKNPFHRVAAPGNAARVLVAEDNLVNQRLVSLMLERAGYSATIVSDGHQCLAALRDAPFDVILMDCHMPSLDGYETTRRIRTGEAGSGVQSIPVIALTASVMEDDRIRCLAAGMDSFLSKPVHSGDLLAALDRICPGVPVS